MTSVLKTDSITAATENTDLVLTGNGTGKVTLPSGTELGGTAFGTAATLNAGSGSGDLLRTDGDGSSLTGLALRTYGTPVTLESVASVTFSGIPSGTERVEVSVWDIDFATSDTLCTQLGDSGGIETSGYVNQVSSYAEQDDSGTDRFRHKTSGSTTQGMAGMIQYTRVEGNKWTYQAIITGNRHDFSAGRKELSGELTQIKLFGTFGYNMTGYAQISYE